MRADWSATSDASSELIQFKDDDPSFFHFSLMSPAALWVGLLQVSSKQYSSVSGNASNRVLVSFGDSGCLHPLLPDDCIKDDMLSSRNAPGLLMLATRGLGQMYEGVPACHVAMFDAE